MFCRVIGFNLVMVIIVSICRYNLQSSLEISLTDWMYGIIRSLVRMYPKDTFLNQIQQEISIQVLL